MSSIRVLANRVKISRLDHVRETLGLTQMKKPVEIPVASQMLEKFGKDITKCSQCIIGKYELLLTKRLGKITYRKPIKILG